MTLPFNSDVSLYELVTRSGTAPNFLQVSPPTFKSVFGALLELLTEHKLPATVWVKLPHGAAWQGELKQYCDLPDIPYVVYLLNTHRDEKPDEVGGAIAKAVETTLTDSEEAPATISEPLQPTPQASIIPIQLATEQLKREYFILIESAQLCALVLAHRPRSKSESIDKPTSEPGQLEEGDRKHPLELLLTFDIGFMQLALQGIRQTVAAIPDPGVANPDLEAHQQQWASAFTDPMFRSNPTLLSQLFARQTQRQEDLWHRVSTYRRQAETAETLSIQNQELLTSLQFKDEFLSNVGQELRTPLTNMKTALSLLNSPNLKPPQRQRYMDLLSQECDRQSSIISSLQELVRLDQVVDHTTFQALRLNEVVPGVVSIYQPLAEEKGLRLAYTVPEDLPPVSCMNDWLKQIVINLLDNSIKFTPRGGQVWVRAKQQGDYVQVEFRDNGIGIAPGEIPKVFDRFYRARQSASEETGGVGLGLTIVQQLLLHCGGSISVKSKLGEGSSFNVLLPIHKKTET
jgi:two-component system, OmpR family, phosphate regulon sensor histidine kinase PhoR